MCLYSLSSDLPNILKCIKSSRLDKIIYGLVEDRIFCNIFNFIKTKVIVLYERKNAFLYIRLPNKYCNI